MTQKKLTYIYECTEVANLYTQVPIFSRLSYKGFSYTVSVSYTHLTLPTTTYV